MFFFFGYPILFLLPFFLMLLALRAGNRTLGQDRNRSVFSEFGYPDGSGARQIRGIEARIFRLAYRLGGRVTVSDVVVELGVGVDEAESFLQRLSDNEHVRMDVSDDGLVFYEFPEIVHRLNNEGPDRTHRG